MSAGGAQLPGAVRVGHAAELPPAPPPPVPVASIPPSACAPPVPVAPPVPAAPLPLPPATPGDPEPELPLLPLPVVVPPDPPVPLSIGGGLLQPMKRRREIGTASRSSKRAPAL